MVRLISINYITYTPKTLFYLPTQHHNIAPGQIPSRLEWVVSCYLPCATPKVYVRQGVNFFFPGPEREVRLPTVPSCLHMLSICFTRIYGSVNKFIVRASC